MRNATRLLKRCSSGAGLSAGCQCVTLCCASGGTVMVSCPTAHQSENALVFIFFIVL